MGPSAISKTWSEEQTDVIDYNPAELDNLSADDVIAHAHGDMEADRLGEAWMQGSLFEDLHLCLDVNVSEC